MNLKTLILVTLTWLYYFNLSAQNISSCIYKFPSYGCDIEFPCGAKVDSTNRDKLQITKEFKKSTGELIANVQWQFFKSTGFEKTFFDAMIKFQKEFARNEKFKNEWNSSREASFGAKNEPMSSMLSCGDTVYCANFLNYYSDQRNGKYTSYMFVNASNNATGFFHVVFKWYEGFNLDQFRDYGEKVKWYSQGRIVAPKSKISMQLPAGIFNAVETDGGVFVYKLNMRDSAFMSKAIHSNEEIMALKDFYYITRNPYNTLSAVQTVEKEISENEKKRGWTTFPAEKLVLQGSQATEITRIKSFTTYKDAYDKDENDSCAYYILSFQDSKVKPKLSANLRTILVVYVPLKEKKWFRGINHRIRHRFFATLKPEYDE